MARTRKQRIAVYGLVSTIVILIVSGAWLVLSENSKHDIMVANDLQELSSSVEHYAARNRHLPYNLDMLSMADLTRDHIITNRYQYNVEDRLHYQLCAPFTTDSSRVGLYTMTQRLDHGVGDQCFNYSIPARGVGQ